MSIIHSSASSTNPDTQLIEKLRTTLDDALRDALGGASEVALVNFHNLSAGWPRWVGNPGDMAIWQAVHASLRRLNVRVAYQAAYNTLSIPALRRAVPFGPVLITGGGDFGDLYTFGTPETRERLLAELRGVPIIQLPIAVYFKDPANTARIQRIIAEHNNFTLMVRDQLSEQRARKHLDTDIRLTPDMAFALGPLPRPTKPSIDLVWNAWRASDPEHVDHGSPPPGVASRTIEWASKVQDEPSVSMQDMIVRTAHIQLGTLLARWPSLRGALWRPYAATFEPLCRASIRRGLRLESAGRVLVTNKLHGHIFALLAGIPHVVLDNSFGKVRGVYETWTSSSTLAHWVEDGDSARRRALELLELLRTS
ncbi:polysaccharide pyruvyl transferase family protein [Phytoactinopolyspora endophytica]|uniref:polysaccharide pyruvyl transferase family protein n=1 Tax=Phytoactinopolyspora endophytica TaxID=1642495 RepID=UPI00101D5A05|nr:polysaccharide pyruvyl transferase family protein [Phytoactinopolyspora endophytica]